MNKVYVVVLVALIIILQGCTGSKKQVETTSKYKRKPIVEVSLERLNNDALLIDAKMQNELGNDSEAWKLYHKLLKSDSTYAVAYYELALMCYSLRMNDSSLYYGEKAYSLEPDNVWYALFLADVYKMLSRYDDAIKVWETVVKQYPEELEYYYELANVYIANNQPNKAIGVYNRIEKRIGVSEAISLQKKKIWESLNKNDKAIAEVEKLAGAFPADNKYNLILAELFMAKKDYNKAYFYYNKVLTRDPDDKYIHISLANYYKCVDEHDKAYDELKKGFESNSLTTNEKIQILTTFYTSEEFYGKYSKYAYDLTDVVLKNSNDTVTYALFYGDVLMRRGQYKEAAHQLNNYLLKDSSNYDIWEALLICESELKNNDDRLQILCKRVINLFPIYPLPYYLNAFILYQKDDYGEALHNLEEGEAWIGDNKYLRDEFMSLMAECYYRVGDYKKAYNSFDKFLENNPDNLGMLNNYSYYLSERNEQLEKAEQMSLKTIEAEPENATFLDTYGWIMYKMGRYKEAEKYIRKAIDNDKTPSATLYMHYGDVMDKLNQPDKAKEYWNKAKELDKDLYQEIPDDMKIKTE